MDSCKAKAFTNKISACFSNKDLSNGEILKSVKKGKNKQCSSLDCSTVPIIFPATETKKRKQMIQTDSKIKENKGLQTALNHASVRHTQENAISVQASYFYESVCCSGRGSQSYCHLHIVSTSLLFSSIILYTQTHSPRLLQNRYSCL